MTGPENEQGKSVEAINMDLKLTKIQKLREAEAGWSTKLTTRSTLNFDT